MKEELDKALCAKYPLIFAQRHGDLRETCMCWGFACGDGWYDLIDTLCSNIQEHLENKASHRQWLIDNPRATDVYGVEDNCPDIPQVEAAQVKEKFGGLRFVIDGGDDYVRGLISMAESLSFSTCEDCGNKGDSRGSGWVKTLCEPCDDRRKEKNRIRLEAHRKKHSPE